MLFIVRGHSCRSTHSQVGLSVPTSFIHSLVKDVDACCLHAAAACMLHHDVHVPLASLPFTPSFPFIHLHLVGVAMVSSVNVAPFLLINMVWSFWGLSYRNIGKDTNLKSSSPYFPAKSWFCSRHFSLYLLSLSTIRLVDVDDGWFDWRGNDGRK